MSATGGRPAERVRELMERIATAAGVAAKVEVRKGLKSDTDVVIIKGLKSGDVVATTNVKDIKDGATVKAAPAATPSPSASTTTKQ